MVKNRWTNEGTNEEVPRRVARKLPFWTPLSRGLTDIDQRVLLLMYDTIEAIKGKRKYWN